MPEFRTNHHVPHSAEAMFALVADVDRYPEFVPFCESLTVRGRRREGEREVLVADMAVGYKLLRENFTSKVTLDHPALSIRADYLDGPFRSMENSWHFAPHPDGGCTVEFCIQYEFRSKTLALLMGTLFEKVFARFSGAFEARADEIYGLPGGAPA